LKGGEVLSVITDAVVQKLMDDPVLSGTKDPTTGDYRGDGLLTLMQISYWDGTQVKKRLVPSIYSWQDYTAPIRSSNQQTSLAFIQCAGHTADVPSLRFGSKTRRARDITRDIFCFYQQDKYTNTNDEDYSYVEKMAERVYELFDRQTLNIPVPSDTAHYTTWRMVKCRANGPIILPWDQSGRFDARLDVMQVTIQFTIEEV
jgi:hypothetical protein